MSELNKGIFGGDGLSQSSKVATYLAFPQPLSHIPNHIPEATFSYLDPYFANHYEPITGTTEACAETHMMDPRTCEHAERMRDNRTPLLTCDFDSGFRDNNIDPLLLPAHDGSFGDSFASEVSVLTELSDVSSLSSSESSKATTPQVFESSRPATAKDKVDHPVDRDDKSHSGTQSQHRKTKPGRRLNFKIRPRSSIPTSIPPHQYTNECIRAAESSRLNPYALHSEEYRLFRNHITQAQITTYLNIRNGILRLWMAHTCIAVSRQEAVGCASTRWFDAANACYDWLVRRGYINFGCVRISETRSVAQDHDASRRRRKVVVIGAGISGLACARQLDGLFRQYADRFLENGEDLPTVSCVEGRNRIGGRVHSREFRSKQAKALPQKPATRHTAELGGMIITGFDRGNPINVLVRGQLGLPYRALSAETTIYDSDGQPVHALRDQLIEKLYNECLDRVSEFKHKPLQLRRVHGQRNLLKTGRDGNSERSQPSSHTVEAASLAHAKPLDQQSELEGIMVPVFANKLTGRVHTEPGVSARFNSESNALAKVEKMGWTVKDEATQDENINLEPAAALPNATLGSVIDYAISRYKRLIDLNTQDHRLLNWHIANLEYSNAMSLRNLSLSLWDLDAGNEWEGQHTMVIGGYQSVARGLLECPSKLDITTRFAVNKIRYSDSDATSPSKVVIESEDGSILEADYVVCSTPLGVLKHRDIAFDPPLPSWKSGVIDRLGFGILNKVVMLYEEVFWKPDRHIFGVLRDAPDRDSLSQEDYAQNRGRFFQWFNVSDTTGLPCLLALIAGDAGYEVEKASNEGLVAEATEVLRTVFGKHVPYPVESVVTRWGCDRFARGSYSSAALGMLPDDYDAMARPVGNLYFAGEHTIGTHPATVHGAYLSGLRAASEVFDAMMGPIEVPEPLILPRDSSILHKRKAAIGDPQKERLEAFEVELQELVRSQLGERPSRPSKMTGNAYLLYSKENLTAAKRRCEESRRAGRSRGLPNEVRVMTSKMWKAASPEERKPYEDQADQQKRAYAQAIRDFNLACQTWDEKAKALREAYEKAKANTSGTDDDDDEVVVKKHRRAMQAVCSEASQSNPVSGD